MSTIDRRALAAQLAKEFPSFTILPWYEQYRQLKAGCPDAVLFYRMGDFYETFDDDAKLVAELLEVTLTYKKFAKDKRSNAEQRCPMAGMPYHAIERYVSGLVSAGYRVAIAEQVSETPSSRSDTRPKSIFAAGLEQGSALKDMVERKVVRVITPGTITDSALLNAAQNNYLVALIKQHGTKTQIGLAYADLSTGEFACTEFSGDRATQQALGELARLNAAEVLVPDDEALRLPGVEPAHAGLTQDLEFLTKQEREMLLPGERVARRTERESSARWTQGHVTAWPARRWDARITRDDLLHHFGVRSLAGFGLADKPLAVRAAGALLQYVKESQNGAATHMQAIRAYTTGDVMFLDPQTRRNLELLEGSGGKPRASLISVLDQTRTPMGARLLRRWVSQPLLDMGHLHARQDSVAFFADSAMLRTDVRDRLKQLGDMERAVNRVLQGVTIATPRDLVRLREALRTLPGLIDTLGPWRPPRPNQVMVAADSSPSDDELALFDVADVEAQIDDAPEERGPSLREQRERGRHIQARYDNDDLFGDDSDDEPVTQQRPAPRTANAATGNATTARATARPAVAAAVAHSLDACADVLRLLEAALDDDPPALLGASNYLRAAEENGEAPRRVIRPGYDADMDKVVNAALYAQQYISGLEGREQQRTGIKGLRVGYNQVFGYYIEVAKSYANDVPADYIRKQTLTSGERYYTQDLKEYESVVTNAKERLADLERRAFVDVCAQVAEHGPRLLATARLVAEIDVYASLADVAVRWRYVRPELHDDQRLRIRNGRHPVVEQALGNQFIANDAMLDTTDHQMLLVTGPNMAGKSTTLRQVALIVLMAQIGSFVPAEHAEIGLADRIFTRIGAQDDIATGQSTFMVEMSETAALLMQSTRRSLIILDEVGRGTSTYDGMAIARAVVEYIHNEPRLGCRTLFATHYHELVELEDILPRVKNYHMAAIEQDGQVVFLHELRRGGADRSYGIHVAEIAGIPRAVIKRAGELLAELEQGSASKLAPATKEQAAPQRGKAQLGLFDVAPSPLVEMIKRLNVNELSPIEALTKLYELQRLAQQEL